MSNNINDFHKNLYIAFQWEENQTSWMQSSCVSFSFSGHRYTYNMCADCRNVFNVKVKSHMQWWKNYLRLFHGIQLTEMPFSIHGRALVRSCSLLPNSFLCHSLNMIACHINLMVNIETGKKKQTNKNCKQFQRNASTSTNASRTN